MVRRRVSLLLVVLLVLGLAAACGASSRTRALRTSLVALNAARDTTLALSKAREKQIYDSCNPPTCTKEEGHARADAWRAEVDVVIGAIDAGYRAVHDAALLDDAKSAIDAGAAAKKALDFYEQLKQKDGTEPKEKP